MTPSWAGQNENKTFVLGNQFEYPKADIKQLKQLPSLQGQALKCLLKAGDVDDTDTTKAQAQKLLVQVPVICTHGFIRRPH